MQMFLCACALHNLGYCCRQRALVSWRQERGLIDACDDHGCICGGQLSHLFQLGSQWHDDRARMFRPNRTVQMLAALEERVASAKLVSKPLCRAHRCSNDSRSNKAGENLRFGQTGNHEFEAQFSQGKYYNMYFIQSYLREHEWCTHSTLSACLFLSFARCLLLCLQTYSPATSYFFCCIFHF